MAARSFAYHAHGTADSDKFCCYPWLVCHDIKSAMHCSLRLAPTMINHLASLKLDRLAWLAFTIVTVVFILLLSLNLLVGGCVFYTYHQYSKSLQLCHLQKIIMVCSQHWLTLFHIQFQGNGPCCQIVVHTFWEGDKRHRVLRCTCSGRASLNWHQHVRKVTCWQQVLLGRIQMCRLLCARNHTLTAHLNEQVIFPKGLFIQ